MEPNTDLDGLNDEDVRIRASAIIAMGRAGDRQALKQLTGILEDYSEISWIRVCAAIALGRLSGKEVVPPLIKALEDTSILVSRAAILALAETGVKEAIPYLQEVLKNQSKKDLHALSVNALKAIGGHEITSTLIEALESPDNRVRCNAALALGDLRAGEAVRQLINLVSDSDESVRAVAASSLGLIGDKRASEALIEALNDEAETVRAISASSLGYLSDVKAVPPLEKVVHDQSTIVRKQAAAALSKLRQKK
jgi:HEAT repeat protein